MNRLTSGEVVHADSHAAIVQEAVDEEGKAHDEQGRVLGEAGRHFLGVELLLLLGRRLDDFLGAKDGREDKRDRHAADHERCQQVAADGVALGAGELGDERDEERRCNGAGDRGDEDTIAGERGSLTRIRGDNAVQRGERDVPRGGGDNGNKVEDAAVGSTGADAPVRMCPEQQDDQRDQADCAAEHPRAIAAHLGVGAVGQRADHRVIDGVPDPADQEQDGDGARRDEGDIRHEKGQIRADQHPRQVIDQLTGCEGKLSRHGLAAVVISLFLGSNRGFRFVRHKFCLYGCQSPYMLLSFSVISLGNAEGKLRLSAVPWHATKTCRTSYKITRPF